MNAQQADAMAFPIRRHAEITDLFADVAAAEGKDRENAFRRFIHLLAVHETAEEELGHLYARQVVDGAIASSPRRRSVWSWATTDGRPESDHSLSTRKE
ncbi:hypothetical protein ACQPYK_20465 [Streptosporangium sp. CA-135522]|uniref:hypothetical protein n=1 Tax=Streptosporangium sp. CA-135522 TaxID=3240072 RepID=UPI003D8DC5E2